MRLCASSVCLLSSRWPGEARRGSAAVCVECVSVKFAVARWSPTPCAVWRGTAGVGVPCAAPAVCEGGTVFA